MQLIFAEYTFRLDVEEGVGIPQIPVHPIGYNDAEILLRYNFLVGFENKIFYTSMPIFSSKTNMFCIRMAPEIGKTDHIFFFFHKRRAVSLMTKK